MSVHKDDSHLLDRLCAIPSRLFGTTLRKNVTLAFAGLELRNRRDLCTAFLKACASWRCRKLEIVNAFAVDEKCVQAVVQEVTSSKPTKSFMMEMRGLESGIYFAPSTRNILKTNGTVEPLHNLLQM